MNRQILQEYIHACVLVEEAEQELKSLEKKKIPAVLGKVKGSNPNFPYQECSFTVSGLEYSYEDDIRERKERKILQERRDRANDVKLQVEDWMNTIPMRMQRIIKYRFFDGLTWEETAEKIGGGSTGESVKKIFQRFMEKK